MLLGSDNVMVLIALVQIGNKQLGFSYIGQGLIDFKTKIFEKLLNVDAQIICVSIRLRI